MAIRRRSKLSAFPSVFYGCEILGNVPYYCQDYDSIDFWNYSLFLWVLIWNISEYSMKGKEQRYPSIGAVGIRHTHIWPFWTLVSGPALLDLEPETYTAT